MQTSASPYTLFIRWWRRGWRINPPDGAYLKSSAYDKEMGKDLQGPAGLHEATEESPSFLHRHKVVNRSLGTWRWRGMHELKDRILPIIEGGAFVVDFGGGGCPLGLGSVVVDHLKRDYAGWPVRYHDLGDLPRKADVVFTSHCLEHIDDIHGVIRELRESMAEGGDLIVFVPSWTCERWRAGVHGSRVFNDHVWTFALEEDDDVPDLPRLARIDTLLGSEFELLLAQYCGDDSIFIHARAN